MKRKAQCIGTTTIIPHSHCRHRQALDIQLILLFLSSFIFLFYTRKEEEDDKKIKRSKNNGMSYSFGPLMCWFFVFITELYGHRQDEGISAIFATLLIISLEFFRLFLCVVTGFYLFHFICMVSNSSGSFELVIVMLLSQKTAHQ